MTALDPEEFPWAVVYRTAYGDYDILAVFTKKRNALRVCDVWLMDCKDDEEVVVVKTEEALDVKSGFVY
jgi:hypothetical protein